MVLRGSYFRFTAYNPVVKSVTKGRSIGITAKRLQNSNSLILFGGSLRFIIDIIPILYVRSSSFFKKYCFKEILITVTMRSLNVTPSFLHFSFIFKTENYLAKCPCLMPIDEVPFGESRLTSFGVTAAFKIERIT